MLVYRDGGGTFHLMVALAGAVPGDLPPLMRFVDLHGVALPLWPDGRTDEMVLLQGAGLDWPVERRPVLVPDRRSESGVAEVQGYRALVRPDTREVMSVVTTAYQEADNRLVAETVGLARQCDPRAALVGAAGVRAHD